MQGKTKMTFYVNCYDFSPFVTLGSLFDFNSDYGFIPLALR